MIIAKDKKSIKYFLLSGILLICIYSNVIAKVFNPIFDNIYYGNLTKMFEAVISAIIWGVEIGIIAFVYKKLNLQIFTDKEKKKAELQTWQIILLFIITLLPMLIISASIGWKVKIVYALGERVTLIGLLCNACEILAYAVRMVLMIMFIVSIQKGFETIFKTKYLIPYGAIFAFLTFGIIDFFLLTMDLRIFYLIVSLLYGIIYLVADRRFCITWILCYLIYLL